VTSIAELRAGCAVVTGAGSGIGAAAATHAASELGLPVAVLDVVGDRAETTAAEITAAGGTAVAWTADVADAAAVDAVAEAVRARLGPVTLLMANAGVEHAGAVWTMPADQWRRVQDVNVNGVFNTLRAFVGPMVEARRRAHVVCVASIGALAIRPEMSAYIVSKHATLALAESLTVDLAAAGADIGVSVLLPGPVATRIAVDALVAPTDGAEPARRRLATLLDAEGLAPSEIAATAFAGVAEDREWIYTHPRLTGVTVAERVAKLEASVARPI